MLRINRMTLNVLGIFLSASASPAFAQSFSYSVAAQGSVTAAMAASLTSPGTGENPGDTSGAYFKNIQNIDIDISAPTKITKVSILNNVNVGSDVSTGKMFGGVQDIEVILLNAAGQSLDSQISTNMSQGKPPTNFNFADGAVAARVRIKINKCYDGQCEIRRILLEGTPPDRPQNCLVRWGDGELRSMFKIEPTGSIGHPYTLKLVNPSGLATSLNNFSPTLPAGARIVVGMFLETFNAPPPFPAKPDWTAEAKMSANLNRFFWSEKGGTAFVPPAAHFWAQGDLPSGDFKPNQWYGLISYAYVEYAGMTAASNVSFPLPQQCKNPRMMFAVGELN